MGAKQKKALKKNLKKVSSQLPVSSDRKDAADFLPLEGGPGRKLPEEKPLVNKAAVLYIGRIRHGFYEKEMHAFFSQFGTIKRLRIARNKKLRVLNTGKSKHFGFIEFNDPEVAEVVADAMHGYLLFEHILQVHLIPPEHVHLKLWRGFNCQYKPLDWVEVECKRLNKVRTLEEHKKLMEKILKHDQKRRKRIEAASIDLRNSEIYSSSCHVGQTALGDLGGLCHACSKEDKVEIVPRVPIPPRGPPRGMNRPPGGPNRKTGKNGPDLTHFSAFKPPGGYPPSRCPRTAGPVG
ncbi:RRM domain-containing protein [Citrus sinensis]|uniref:RRM domain-containing protein n=1 Tax=Citrus sinensis TaxID=2711 RepID=A0ACB8K2V1_CITSI|nr:RRM domain-containing protein [Citrus sinensis]